MTSLGVTVKKCLRAIAVRIELLESIPEVYTSTKGGALNYF